MQQQQAQQSARPTSNTHEATTVRNLVNLKKHTLRLAPREGAPGVLEISFALDVVSVCRYVLGNGTARVLALYCCAKSAAAITAWLAVFVCQNCAGDADSCSIRCCRVSIFLIAQEDNSTGAITAKKVICDGVECPVGVRSAHYSI